MIEVELKKQLNSAEGILNLDVKFGVKSGQLISLFGESGSGKTSILRMISGLMNPDSGRISKNEQLIYDSEKGLSVDIQKRKIGFLSQDYALFPNMTVFQNLNYALKKGEKTELVRETIDFLGLKEMAEKKPETLSGGQKQRVALGRCLVNKPELLLLDEPLSALDGKMRLELQNYILKIHRELNLTIILVTHDISEVLRLSEEVHILEKGNIVNSGSPESIFLQNEISGKFQFSGEIIKVELQGFISILHVLIGNNLIKVISENSQEEFNVGDKVNIASKAFNPIITKI